MLDFSDAVRWNSEALRVPPPKCFLAGGEFFLTPTTMAATAEDGSGIALNRDVIRDELTLWMAVSHELRHVWQIRQNPGAVDGYAAANGAAVEAYNGQEAEIDAHAWAVFVLGHLFGVRPTLEQQLGPELWEEILRRVDDFKKEAV